MITASTDFEITLGTKAGSKQKHFFVSLSVALTGAYDEVPLTVELTREMLVQVAILMTTPEHLDQLAGNLIAAKPEPSPQLPLPLASALKRVK